MLESKYIVIQGFMIESLKLKGNELLAYALIYGFTMDKKPKPISLSYIAKWLSSTRTTTAKTIKSLETKKLISKSQRKGKHGAENTYKTTSLENGLVRQNNQSKNYTSTSPKTRLVTSPENGPQYLYVNKYPINTKKTLTSVSVEKRHTHEPTLEELQEYTKERRYPIDTEKCLAYFRATDWKVGGVKTEWKNAVDYWAITDKTNHPTTYRLKQKELEEKEKEPIDQGPVNLAEIMGEDI